MCAKYVFNCIYGEYYVYEVIRQFKMVYLLKLIVRIYFLKPS